MVIVNQLTSQILKSHLETSFGNYFDWRERNGDAADTLLEIRAIEFPADEAYFLAGPIGFQGKTYGMAYFQYKEDAEPIEVLEQRQIDSMKRIRDLSWAPYSIRTQFSKYLDPHSEIAHNAATEYFYDPVTKISFSAIDLRFGGADELGHKVVTRGKKESRARAKREGKVAQMCQAFWHTKIAEERIRDYMGKDAVEAILAKQAELALKWNEEERYVTFCKERPYSLYLLGTDDTSYTKTFATKEEMYKFADRIKGASSEFVTSQMTFTN